MLKVNCPKKKDNKIFHKKLDGKLKIYLYIKGSNICSEMKWTLYWKRYFSISSMLYL
jgi:hypothetical protein